MKDRGCKNNLIEFNVEFGERTNCHEKLAKILQNF